MKLALKSKTFVIAAAAAAVLALAVACGGGARPSPTPSNSSITTESTTLGGSNVSSGTGATSSSNTSAPASGIASDAMGRIAPAAYPTYANYGGSGPLHEGIYVTGTGTASIAPNVAVLNIGVSATGATVNQALDKANTSLNAMLAALSKQGVDSKDIQTQYFSIYPQYTGRQIYSCDNGTPTPLPDGSSLPSKPDSQCVQEWQQVLTGYQVSNQLTVKVRDIKNTGPVIDSVTAAGGDAAQISGINFTVDDNSALVAKAQEAAVKAAMAQAQQFATLTGVTLGKPVHISQVSGYMPELSVSRDAMTAPAAGAAPTSVLPGELQVSVTVQILYAIQ